MKTSIPTSRLATLALEHDRLQADLECARGFTYSSMYSEFICGQWQSCMLWNHSGCADDARLTDYTGMARQTELGIALPYLSELLRTNFQEERLRFVRLVNLRPGSVIVPHRDFLELGSELHRIHIPLQTDALCFNSEDATVYQMRSGEVWFIDATRVHSAASFSSRDRLHLILDFAPAETVSAALRLESVPGVGIPADSTVQRPGLSDAEEKALSALRGVIDRDNFRDILALLIRKHFRRRVHGAEVLSRMIALAQGAGDPHLTTLLEGYRENFLIQRSE